MLRYNPVVRSDQPHSNHHNFTLLPHWRCERGSFRVRIQHPRQRVVRGGSAEEVQEDNDALEGKEEEEREGSDQQSVEQAVGLQRCASKD